jgi:hypothetical protein
MDNANREDRPGCADRMAVRDRTTLDIDDVFGQTQLAHNGDNDPRKSLVDLDPLNIAKLPAGPIKGLADGGDGTKSNDSRGFHPDGARLATVLK